MPSRKAEKKKRNQEGEGIHQEGSGTAKAERGKKALRLIGLGAVRGWGAQESTWGGGSYRVRYFENNLGVEGAHFNKGAGNKHGGVR